MGSISPVSMVVFALAALVIIIAQSILIVSAWRYSRQVKNDTGVIHAGAQFELLWATAPIFFLALILWFSIQAIIR